MNTIHAVSQHTMRTLLMLLAALLWITPAAHAVDPCWEEHGLVVVPVGTAATVTSALHCDDPNCCCEYTFSDSVTSASAGETLFSHDYCYSCQGDCPMLGSGTLTGSIHGVGDQDADPHIIRAWIVRASGATEEWPSEGSADIHPGDRLFLEALACTYPDKYNWVWRTLQESLRADCADPPHCICDTEYAWLPALNIRMGDCDLAAPQGRVVRYRQPLIPAEDYTGYDPVEDLGLGHYKLELRRFIGDEWVVFGTIKWRTLDVHLTGHGPQPCVVSMHQPPAQMLASIETGETHLAATLTATSPELFRLWVDGTVSHHDPRPGPEPITWPSGQDLEITWNDTHCWGSPTGSIGPRIDPLADFRQVGPGPFPARFEIEPRLPGRSDFRLRCNSFEATTTICFVNGDLDFGAQPNSEPQEEQESQLRYYLPINDDDDDGDLVPDLLDGSPLLLPDNDLIPLCLSLGPLGGPHHGSAMLCWGNGEVGGDRLFRVWADPYKNQELADLDEQQRPRSRFTWPDVSFTEKIVYAEACRIPGDRTLGAFTFTYDYRFDDGILVPSAGSDGNSLAIGAAQINAHVDSDNNNNDNEHRPDEFIQEDQIEDAPDRTGLVLPLNQDDDDDDGIDDRLDGYNNDATAVNNDDFNLFEDDIYPLTLRIVHPAVRDVDQAPLLADSQVFIQVNDGQVPPHQLEQNNAKVRLWLGDQVAPRGAWLPNGVYRAGDLGFGADATGNVLRDKISIFVEGVQRSRLTGDVQILVRVDCAGDNRTAWDHADKLRLTVVGCDLDIDSDNDDGLDLPEQNLQEEAVEQDAPGKYVVLNDDDDDANGVRDLDDAGESIQHSDNDLAPLVVSLPFDMPWRLRAQSGASRVRVWKSREKGTGREIVLDAWQPVGQGLFHELYVEGVAAGTAPGDVQLVLEVDADGSGTWSTNEPADTVRITVLEVRLDTFPDEPIDVDADRHRAYGVVLVSYRDLSTGEFQDAADGSRIDWRLVSTDPGGQVEPWSETLVGAASTELTTATVAGRAYRIQGNLTRLQLADGTSVGAGYAGRTHTFTVVPGAPTTIDLQQSKTAYHSDNTDIVDFTATISDAWDNHVADDTVVSWETLESTSAFEAVEDATSNGIARATLLAPATPDDQHIRASAGTVSANATMSVSRVTASIAQGRFYMDIGQAESQTLLLSATAADGTPVHWCTTNGTITPLTEIVDGQTQALLSTTGGYTGPVTVLASLGDRLVPWFGRFLDVGGLASVIDHPVLVNDIPGNCVLQIVGYDGSVLLMPAWVSTAVAIQGAPDEIVQIEPASPLPLEWYTCDAASNDQVPGQITSHTMTLQGATLDLARAHAGTGSIHFDGLSTATIADAADLNFTDNFSLQLWVRPETVSAATLMAKGNAWQLDVLPDGHVRATVGTTQGTCTATTTQTLQASQWSRVTMVVSHGTLMVACGDTAAFATIAGTLATSSAAITVGASFGGNIDEVGIHTSNGAMSSLQVYSVNPEGKLELSPSGGGTIWMFNPMGAQTGWSTQEIWVRGSGTGGQRQSLTVVVLTSRENLEAAFRLMLIAAGLQDPNGFGENLVSFVGGLFPYSPSGYGTVIRQVWYLCHGDAKYSAWELGMGGVDVLSSAIPGARSVYRAARGILHAKREARMAKVIFKDLKVHGMVANSVEEALPAARRALLETLEADAELLELMGRLRWSDELLEASTEAFARFGQPFAQALKTAIRNEGPEVAERVLRVACGSADEVADILKQSGKLAEALADLTKIVKAVPDTQSVLKILNNPALRGRAYSHLDLLSDLAYSDLSLANARQIILRLANTSENALKGGCFEVCSAAYLKRAQNMVLQYGDTIVGTASVDSVDAADVLYQCKAVTALSYTTRAKSFKGWCEAARKATGTYAKVKWVVPEGTTITGEFATFLQLAGMVPIEVPFRW